MAKASTLSKPTDLAEMFKWAMIIALVITSVFLLMTAQNANTAFQNMNKPLANSVIQSQLQLNLLSNNIRNMTLLCNYSITENKLLIQALSTRSGG